MNTTLGWYEAPAGLKRAVGVLTIAALLVWSVGPIPFANASDSGLLAPTATHAPNGWTTPGNGFANDSAYATATSESVEQGYSSFGFTVPGGSSIGGIEVVANALALDTSGCVLEVALSGNNGSTFTALKTAPLTGSESALAFGSSSDLWGGVWTASNFTDGNFVARVSFDDAGPGNTCTNGTTVSVDDVQVRVTYTEPVANPSLSNSCGLDIALVMDSSGSLNTTELDQTKAALNGFVSALLPSTPTLFSVTDFDSTGNVLQGFTSDTGLLTTAINNPTSGGSTNWADGLADAFGTFDPRVDRQNVIVFASDGIPTEPGTDAQALAAAIAQANTIKNAGTRIIALGIGLEANGLANLESISSADAVYTSSFDTLATDLAALASELCGGTVTVTKVIDADGDLGSTDDQTDGVGWSFNIDGDNYTTDGNGQTASVEVVEGVYTVTETSQAGFVPVGAVCTSGDGTQGTWNSDNAVTGVDVGNTEIVSCTFYNAPLPTITVEKHVIGGGLSSDFSMHVKDSGDNDVVGSPFAGNSSGTVVTVQPGTYTVSETEALEANYTATFSGSCEPDGEMTVGFGDSVTCVVTNTEIIPEPENGDITITKVVTNNQGGELSEGSFTLNIADGDGIISSGAGSAVANDLSAGTYYISENAVEGYTQEGLTCTDGEDNIPVGEGGAITLEAGQTISCTIFNGDDQVFPVISVTKIVCDDEADLPDWADGGPNVTASTAQNFLNEHPGCSLEDGWSFQYALEGNANPGDNIGEAAGAWTTFGPTIAGVTSVSINPTSLVWVREVMQDGFVPFAGTDSDSNVSAEIYCHDDVLNYDNYDYITPVANGETYHCVAFNAVAEGPETGTIVIVKNTNEGDDTFDFDITNGEDGESFEISTVEGGGSEEFETLLPGTYTITENVPEGWDLSSVECVYDEDSVGSSVENGKVVELGAGDTITCTFTNVVESSHVPQCSDHADNDGDGNTDYGFDPSCTSPDDDNESDDPNNPPGGGGGPLGGGPIGGGGGGGGGGGFVLGVSTTGEVLGDSCGLYMDKFIRLGKKNNSDQVMKLQQFLNKWMNAGLPETGYYGPLSLAATNAFQVKYASEILTPWSIPGPTGIVYLTTLRWINMLECPELALTVPGLVDWGQHPDTEK